MRTLPDLFSNNEAWARRVERENPGFFAELARDQGPRYLWIGCSDSRVPANQIVDLSPGDMFVHRNIANLVIHTDMNCLSVLQYAVEVLQVEHVIVCGHYGCGGVRAALDDKRLGMIDNWLRAIQELMLRHRELLQAAGDPDARAGRLSELNAIEQAANVCRTTFVRDAWNRGQDLSVHGWIYDLHDGRLHDLGFTVSSGDELESIWKRALGDLEAAGP